MTFTTAQTIGPFFHDGLAWAMPAAGVSLQPDAAMWVFRGRVLDGALQPVPDALIEAWNGAAPDGDSGLAGPHGFARVATDANGACAFALAPHAGGDANAPLAYITLFARGLLKHQFTAIFAAGAERRSPLLTAVPTARRRTLVASGSSETGFEWEIVLQGERETVFFDYLEP